MDAETEQDAVNALSSLDHGKPMNIMANLAKRCQCAALLYSLLALKVMVSYTDNHMLLRKPW